jgi:hypothetical protein
MIPDSREAIAPLLAFASTLRGDIEAKQALRLFAEDGLSTASWPHDILAAMTAAAQSPFGRIAEQ